MRLAEGRPKLSAIFSAFEKLFAYTDDAGKGFGGLLVSFWALGAQDASGHK
jgi:hypothetical protein